MQQLTLEVKKSKINNSVYMTVQAAFRIELVYTAKKTFQLLKKALTDGLL